MIKLLSVNYLTNTVLKYIWSAFYIDHFVNDFLEKHFAYKEVWKTFPKN